MDIIFQIENLIENNGSDFELSKLFKQYIQEYNDSIAVTFKANQGKDFLVKHTRELDKIITLMYKTVLRRVFDVYLPLSHSIPITIIALGSYAREQLCIHSDIDLMIVYQKCEGYNTELIIEKLLYLVWDSGLKLGHRVHELKDLKNAANEDITIKTAMLESRFITGSKLTWSSVQNELISIRLHNQKHFIIDKLNEAHIRRKKHPTSMQPNIKETIGGLRDSQLLFWIAKSIYDISSLKELSNTIFTDEEYREYRIALELLFRVRSALHLLNNKQEDRLLLELMPQIAKLLGFDSERKLAIKVFASLWRINNFTKIFTKKIVKRFMFEPSNYSLFKNARISQGIFVLEDRLYASYNIQKHKISDLLQILIDLPDRHYKYDSGFLNLFTYAHINKTVATTTYQKIKELFKKNNTYCFFKLFYEAGILNKLIHSFNKVMFLPQFDGYHQYPVDIHSIKCIQSLESINEEHLQYIYDTFNDNEKLLIKTAVLLHDTGKGRKQDHSEVGVKLFTVFAKHLKFSDEMIERGAVIIRYHTLMSAVAFRENIYNETVLYSFLSKIKDEKNLKLLYVLTYADINGVGDNIYTSFNAKLLKDLYYTALDASKRNERISDAAKRLQKEKRIRKSPMLQILTNIQQKKIFAIESNLFFFKYSPDEIIQIAKQASGTKTYSYNVTNTTRLSIDIFRKQAFNIAYFLGTLSYLDVGSMDIFTLFDGIKYFRIEFSENIEDDTITYIEQIIEDSFDMKKEIQLTKPVIKPNEIELDCNHSNTYAQLNIHTKNQRGLLAYIMHIFETNHINIASSKVDSTKTKARDHFLIEKQNNICDNTDKLLELFTRK